eukprot:363897-Chlamydomonas_euryale.AAC.24
MDVLLQVVHRRNTTRRRRATTRRARSAGDAADLAVRGPNLNWRGTYVRRTNLAAPAAALSVVRPPVGVKPRDACQTMRPRRFVPDDASHGKGRLGRIVWDASWPEDFVPGNTCKRDARAPRTVDMACRKDASGCARMSARTRQQLVTLLGLARFQRVLASQLGIMRYAHNVLSTKGKGACLHVAVGSTAVHDVHRHPAFSTGVHIHAPIRLARATSSEFVRVAH